MSEQRVRGERVKALRRGKGMSQAQLAFYSKVAQSYISAIERGEEANVGGVPLSRMADILGTSTDYLMGKTEDPGPARTDRRAGELTHDEAEVLETYRCLNDSQRYVARETLRAICQATSPTAKPG